MPSKIPEKKKYNCIACQDTKKDSTGGDCFPCSINRKIEPRERPVAKILTKEERRVAKLPQRKLPPKRS
jgi:hypothetical protein